jgi:hypothetical protein
MAGGMWAVYRMEYFQSGSSGTKVSQHRTRQEASEEVYRLNGWVKSKNKTEILQK